jgi:hypothetical protein
MDNNTTTETPGYQELTILGPNLPREAKATFHVHAAGCADMKRGWLGRHTARDGGWNMHARCLVDVEATVYDFAPDENEDYKLGDYLSEFHFAPCVHLPETVE